MKKIKNNTNIIFLIILSLCFIILSYLVLSNNINKLDVLMQEFILNIRNSYLTSAFLTITNTGSSMFLIILTLILLVVIKVKKNSLYIALNLICSFTTNEIAKNIFTRERPIGINLIEETSYSYPSGHSMVSMAYYGFIIYLIQKYIKNNKIKNIFTIVLSINILLVGFSRIYLGVHYLSDILGGFLLALIYLIIFIKIIKIEKK